MATHFDEMIAWERLNPEYWREICKKSGKSILQLCFYAHQCRNFKLFLMFRRQILRYMSIMEFTFDNKMKNHLGVYIQSPSNEQHNGMVAVFHPSKMEAIRGLNVQRQISFVDLNAAQLKEIFRFLRQRVVLVKCNDMRLFFHKCVVDANDLAEFCHHQEEEKRILEVNFEYETTFRQPFSTVVSAICATRIFVQLTPQCFLPVNGTNNFMLNTDRRQNPIEQLEILYATRAFDDQICADFVKQNIKVNGKFAISIRRMPEPASKAQDLGRAFGPFNRQLAFHTIQRTGAWGYRDV